MPGPNKHATHPPAHLQEKPPDTVVFGCREQFVVPGDTVRTTKGLQPLQRRQNLFRSPKVHRQRRDGLPHVDVGFDVVQKIKVRRLKRVALVIKRNFVVFKHVASVVQRLLLGQR